MYLFVDCVFQCEFLRYEYIIRISNTNETGGMTESEKDFCTGVEERNKHCGCNGVRECDTLAAKVVISYGGRVPASIRGHYEEYKKNASLENEAALCRSYIQKSIRTSGSSCTSTRTMFVKFFPFYY